MIVRFFRVTSLYKTLIFSGSAAILPSAVWNYLPVSLLNWNYLTNLSSPFHIAEISIRRILALIYSFNVVRILNHSLAITVAFCLFVPTSCLLATIAVFKIKTSRKAKYQEISIIFRQIQLLCNTYNRIHKAYIVTVYMLLGPMVFIVYVFMIITKGDEIPILAILMFVCIILISVSLMMYAFDCATAIYSTNTTLSCGFEKVFSSKRDLRLAKKFRQSMPALKIQYLDTNFLESISPLKLLDIAMSQTINLVLVA